MSVAAATAYCAMDYDQGFAVMSKTMKSRIRTSIRVTSRMRLMISCVSRVFGALRLDRLRELRRRRPDPEEADEERQRPAGERDLHPEQVPVPGALVVRHQADPEQEHEQRRRRVEQLADLSGLVGESGHLKGVLQPQRHDGQERERRAAADPEHGDQHVPCLEPVVPRHREPSRDPNRARRRTRNPRPGRGGGSASRCRRRSRPSRPARRSGSRTTDPTRVR